MQRRTLLVGRFTIWLFLSCGSYILVAPLEGPSRLICNHAVFKALKAARACVGDNLRGPLGNSLQFRGTDWA